MEDIIELLHQIGKLKDLKRTGWVVRGIPNPESVADHSFRVAVMALILADEFKLDSKKCVSMALIHDIAESIAGDITPHDGVSEKDKHNIELNAMKTILGKTKNKEILNLWKEYEERKTEEAKFVFELDKMEMLLQAFEYEHRHKKDKINLLEFWKSVENNVKDPKMIKIIEILKKKKVKF